MRNSCTCKTAEWKSQRNGDKDSSCKRLNACIVKDHDLASVISYLHTKKKHVSHKMFTAAIAAVAAATKTIQNRMYSFDRVKWEKLFSTNFSSKFEFGIECCNVARARSYFRQQFVFQCQTSNRIQLTPHTDTWQWVTLMRVKCDLM